MSLKKTIISHVYNEEYLLPFWLNHHRNMFDHGIIINYRSTDNSVSIIKEICPSWEIITTRNSCFRARDVDNEVMDIENNIDGIKIVLNTTEFLFSSKPISYFFSNNLISYGIISYSPYSINEYCPLNIQDIYNNLLNSDIKYHHDRHGTREIHNFKNGKYHIGRHGTYNPSINTDDMHIIWLGFFPFNQQIMNRKLQIKNNIPDDDKQAKNGFQHLFDKDTLICINNESAKTGKPLNEININLYNLLLSYKN
jgi:hypothetical protein